jgi:membrane fusion protein (multidrug efflux system)
MRRLFWLGALGIAVLVIAIGVYILVSKKTSPTTASSPLPGGAAKEGEAMVERLPVKTIQAQRRDLEVTLPVFGAISYLDKVDVAVEGLGVLREVPVQPGDLVQKGQVVAVLDTQLLEKELQTKAALKAQAEAQLHLAAWQYQAQRKVQRVGGISLNDLQEAEAKYREKQAEVVRFQAEMALIQTQLQKATIRSPIAGIVGQRNFNRGERVPRESEKGVVTLMQIDEVYAEAEVNERDIANLRPGLEVVMVPDAYPQTPLRGKIERLDPVLKQESRSMIAKVRLPNPQLLLKPGMFSRMEIVLDKVPQVVAVPTPALRQGPDKTWFVFVVSDDVAFVRKVSIGMATAQWMEIKEGLKPGEAVVVDGAERLKDLSRVAPTPISQPRR